MGDNPFKIINQRSLKDDAPKQDAFKQYAQQDQAKASASDQAKKSLAERLYGSKSRAGDDNAK